MQGITRSRLLVVLAPGPIHAEIGVVLSLPGDGVAVGKQQLHALAFQMVITARVDHCRCFGLRGGDPVAAMSEYLSGKFQSLAELMLHQPAGIDRKRRLPPKSG